MTVQENKKAGNNAGFYKLVASDLIATPTEIATVARFLA